MSFQLITAQTEWAVELPEVKAHLREAAATDDAYIQELIYAAQAKAEEDYDLSLNEVTYDLLLDEFPLEILIWMWPIQSITSVKYTDDDGVAQTVSSSNYATDLFSKPARIKPINGYSWPIPRDSINAVQVRLVTGFATGVIPGDIKEALYLTIADWFDNREDKGRRFARVSERIFTKYKYAQRL
jgi:uncharacterized phiE125 gp8 family phage protein